jgi:transcriptional regulator GlxA family with amidase domain
VFGLAGTVRDVDVTYVRLEGPGTVKAHHGTRLEVPNGWAPERADLLIVPGGGGPAGANGPATGVSAEIAKGTLPKALAAAQRRGLTIAAVCSGALLLGAAGLVRGRPCITHTGQIPELEKFGGVIKRARVVDDGDLVTAGGITCGLDLGIWMVRREFGPDDTLELERALEYELRGAVWTR